MSYTLALANPAIPESIPSSSDVILAARALIESDLETEWKKGKLFPVKLSSGSTRDVQTFSRKVGDARETWFMRISEHDVTQDGTFDEFWNGLGVDHAQHEAQYIPEIVNASLLKTVEPNVSEVWSLHYNLGPMLSPRTFTIVLMTKLSEASSFPPLREGLVVSIPFNTSSDQNLSELEGQWGEGGKGKVGVKGKYAAVEWIRELGNGKVEWRMATTSIPGGMIPGFLATGAIPGAISKDVKHFLEWMAKSRNTQTSTDPPVPFAAPVLPNVIVETRGGSLT
ncbi:hypothetical protein FRB95_008655 [Tulasnella sp. JGI-2019a]|nr:hypothetical protein FRB95_008655 [Tulasnella sp. JGI-2019a]